MPLVAAAHLRRGDRVRISARAHRRVSAIHHRPIPGAEAVTVFVADLPMSRTMSWIPGIRRSPWDARSFSCRPDLLLDTTLGSQHPVPAERG